MNMTMTIINKSELRPSNRLTPDDREFTTEEIRNAVESMDNKKVPGEDGITGDIYKLLKSFLNT
jgi:hypothetical protein